MMSAEQYDARLKHIEEQYGARREAADADRDQEMAKLSVSACAAACWFCPDLCCRCLDLHPYREGAEMIENRNPALVVSAESSLAELAQAIIREHGEVLRLFEQSLERARAAGQLLLTAKARLGHGNWGRWLNATFDFSERTAQRYMLVARRWDDLMAMADTIAGLGYLEALNALAEQDRARTGAGPSGPNPSILSDLAVAGGAPGVLMHFRNAGLITDEQAALLLGLRDVYGADLIRDDLRPSEHAPVVAGSLEADVFINLLRVEDCPVACWAARCPFSSEVPAAVVEGCAMFERHLIERQGRVPHWEVAAFWWACQAALAPAVAEHLSELLDLWLERLRSTLAYWGVIGGAGCPDATNDPQGRSDWWGFRSDLRHGGLQVQAQGLFDGDEVNPEVLACFERGLDEVEKAGSYIVPTAEVFNSRLKRQPPTTEATV
jgi:hypothetical protein